jgi:hypothetical protein
LLQRQFHAPGGESSISSWATFWLQKPSNPLGLENFAILKIAGKDIPHALCEHIMKVKIDLLKHLLQRKLA